MCTCGMRRSIADRVSLVRATMPTSRTNAARPSTFGPISGHDEAAAAVTGEDQVRGDPRLGATAPPSRIPVQTTPTEW